MKIGRRQKERQSRPLAGCPYRQASSGNVKDSAERPDLYKRIPPTAGYRNQTTTIVQRFEPTMSNFKKKLYSGIMWTFVCIAVVFTASAAGANTGILNTKHNLSVSGPGPYKATIEDRICVFCHTPHNASPQTPLWNKKIEAVN
jgi:hypothetical protein